MKRLSNYLLRLEQILDRFPWFLPIASFVGGSLSLVLVNRGYELARLIAFVVLASWIWLIAEPFVVRLLQGKLSTGLTRLISNFVTQTLQQEVLFFILPFIIFSTNIDSAGQLAFTLLVGIVALISTLDPVYEKMVANDRIASFTYHAFCTFLAAMVVIPISAKIPVEFTFSISMIVLIVWLLCAGPLLLARAGKAITRIFVVVFVLGIPSALFVFRSSIPPAGIRVNSAVITNNVTDHQPAESISVFNGEELGQGVYAFASIIAPQGLQQTVIFEWIHEEYTESIEAEITGGRKQGYRIYSVKEHFLEDANGAWKVKIKTPQNQLLKVLHFKVNG